jgi:hypothetical protein
MGCAYDSYEFWVLGPPPVVTITEAPEAESTDKGPNFRWDVEGLVDWSAQCSLDGQAFENCADFFYQAYSPLTDHTSYLNGEHTFVVRTCGTSNGSNPATRECVEDSHTWTRVAPEPGPIDIELTETPDATTFDTSARFIWETTGEQLTGVSCSLDGEAFGRCYTSFAEFQMKGKDYADLAEGGHDFVVRVCGLVDGEPSTDRCAKASYTWTIQLQVCAKFQSKDADGNLVNGQICAPRAELLEQVPETCKTLVEDYEAGDPDITCPVVEEPPVVEPPVEEPPIEEPDAAIVQTFAPKFQVRRATISDGHLDMLIDTTARANGDSVDVTYRSNGRDYKFKAPIANSRIRFREALPKEQRSLKTGIVTVRYAGGDYKGFRVSGVVIRTRAASGKAELRRNVLSLKDGVLVARGSVTDEAKGVVRLILSYDTTTGPKVWEGQAEIQKFGSWKLKEQLPAEARVGGHLSIQFTGYLSKRIRGEQITKQVLAGQEFVSAEDETIGGTD